MLLPIEVVPTPYQPVAAKLRELLENVIVRHGIFFEHHSNQERAILDISYEDKLMPLVSYRSSQNESTGCTPVMLLTSKEIPLPIDLEKKDVSNF